MRDSPPTTGLLQQKVIISDCINYGDITSATGRTAGIVAAANRYTQLANCVNHGKQLNTCPKNDAGRLGNIACNMGAGSSMIGCSNYGDLTSTTGSRCGGITSAAGDATFENCANYGTILTDSPYRGVFWGYNNAVAQWTDCTAGGKVGTYNANAPVSTPMPMPSKPTTWGNKERTNRPLTNIAYQIGNSGGGSAGGDAELRILFIGNSFTKDAVEHLPGILKAMGIDKVKMTHMYYGGRTVPEYNNGFATVNDYRCYECNPGAAGWTESMNKTIKEVAASEQWDVVTIQEHTGKVNAWKWTSAEKEALQGLIDNVKSTQTGAMPRFYYILSQAYADPALVSYSQQTVIVNNFASSQTDMYAAIVAQGQKSNERSRVRRCDRHGHRPAKSPHVETPKRDGHDPRRVPHGLRHFALCRIVRRIRKTDLACLRRCDARRKSVPLYDIEHHPRQLFDPCYRGECPDRPASSALCP